MNDVCNEDGNDRDGITIQAASPAWGGPAFGKRNGAGSISVSDNGGRSSSDIFLVTKKRQKFKIIGIIQSPAQINKVKFR